MFNRVIGYWMVCDQPRCKTQDFILPPKSVVHRKAYAEREAHRRGWKIGPDDKALCVTCARAAQERETVGGRAR